MSVCQSVSVFVCASARQHIPGSTRPIFLFVLPMGVARFSYGGVATRYVLPVLWMTSCLHTMGHVEAC